MSKYFISGYSVIKGEGFTLPLGTYNVDIKPEQFMNGKQHI